MAELSGALIIPKTQGHLRPVDPRRDLLQVADLVELCFKDTLDSDGFSYLRQMRAMARNSSWMTWMYNLAEQASSSPVLGFIWEENGRVIGNASLIPIRPAGANSFLIANVAVHPDFRGRGIGQMLTAAAADYAQSRRVPSTWLQVRADNAPAVHIYDKLGFVERTRRKTWISLPGNPAPSISPGIHIGSRQAREWPQQSVWLDQTYPAMVRWHLTLNKKTLMPGLQGILFRMYSFEFARQWSVSYKGRLRGVLSWLEDAHYGDNLLFAGPAVPDLDELALQNLLYYVRCQVGRRNRLSLNLPASYGEQALVNAGFAMHQDLIWMELVFA